MGLRSTPSLNRRSTALSGVSGSSSAPSLKRPLCSSSASGSVRTPRAKSGSSSSSGAFLADLRDRLAAFGLELAAEKTRLIEFGRFAAERRAARGLGKPETFEFLGFTHICAKTGRGRFKLKRVTSKKRMRAKLHQLKAELKRRWHHSIPEQGRWLASVLAGHFRYYAVPDNIKALQAFRDAVTWHWLRALRRRSQRSHVTWERMARIAARWLPRACIQHPWPTARFDARTQGRSPVR